MGKTSGSILGGVKREYSSNLVQVTCMVPFLCMPAKMTFLLLWQEQPLAPIGYMLRG